MNYYAIFTNHSGLNGVPVFFRLSVMGGNP